MQQSIHSQVNRTSSGAKVVSAVDLIVEERGIRSVPVTGMII
jgi:hypothetical protein